MINLSEKNEEKLNKFLENICKNLSKGKLEYNCLHFNEEKEFTGKLAYKTWSGHFKEIFIIQMEYVEVSFFTKIRLFKIKLTRRDGLKYVRQAEVIQNWFKTKVELYSNYGIDE